MKRNYTRKRKGISPVIAITLLLIVAVLATIGFLTWFKGYQSKVNSNIEVKVGDQFSKKVLNDLIDNNLYVKNSNSNNISVKKVTINGIDCNISENLSSGVNPINLSSCINKINSSFLTISLITNKNIYQRVFYHKKSSTTTSTGSGGTGGTNPQESTNFISVWNVSIDSGSSGYNNLTLPLQSGSLENFTVNWGDGTNSKVTSYNSVNATHHYGSGGVYAVNISGNITGWAFGSSGGDAAKLIDISQWGSLKLSNNGYQFADCNNLVNFTANDTPDLTNVNDLSYMFYQDSKFNGNINDWNTSLVTNMGYMFANASNFNQPLNNWDTNSVTDMGYMFANASNFNQPLNNWDTSSVTDMGDMFYSASRFNQPLNNWNTSMVTNMGGMFLGASSFNQSLDNWNTSMVTNMGGMFSGASSFNQPLDNWNTSMVTNMGGMFNHASSFNQPLNAWDTSSVTNMGCMFHVASSFNQPLNAWDTSSVTNMDCMFSFASSFNQPLNAWDTSSVTNMWDMFEHASSFNQSLNAWDTGSVTNMIGMFEYASSFNQNISNWNVSNLPHKNFGTYHDEFNLGCPIIDSYLPHWVD